MARRDRLHSISDYKETEGASMENVSARYCVWCMQHMEDGPVCPHCGREASAYGLAAGCLPPGTLLQDRYLLGRVLREVTAGVVYLARDLLLERRVVVEEYRPLGCSYRSESSCEVRIGGLGPGAFEAGMAHFVKAAQLLDALPKANTSIPVPVDFFEANGTAYVVSRYIEGTSLSELAELRGGLIPAQELLRLVEPVFGALTALHEKGLWHLGVTPANVMLEDGGRVYLTDVALSRVYMAGLVDRMVFNERPFKAIELYLHASDLGAWTDVYALAATVYSCMCGCKPPTGVERLTASDDPLVQPRQLGADLSEAQERGLMAALQVQPSERTQSMREFHDALYGELPDVIDRQGFAVPGTEGASENPQRPKRARRLPILAAAGAVVLAVTLALVLALDPWHTTEPSLDDDMAAETDVATENPAPDAEDDSDGAGDGDTAAGEDEGGSSGPQEVGSMELVVGDGNASAVETNGDKGPKTVVNATPVRPITSVSAGLCHTVGVYSDGMSAQAGWNDSGQCNVTQWSDVSAISAGWLHTVALRKDHTVLACGGNQDGQCNVSEWTGMVIVAAGGYHTVGLRVDGGVEACGRNEDGQCNVSSWSDIVSVAAGGWHTVGVRSDGTVTATGNNSFGQCDVSGWTDIVSVSAGGGHTVGLRSDGTVVACGYSEDGRCDVSGWTDIVEVSCGRYSTVGLRRDGTVVACGLNYAGRCDVSDWTDIVEVSAGGYHTVGVRRDGTVIATGSDGCGQCDISGW